MRRNPKNWKCEVPVDEAANCDKQKLTAIVRWLETNQPDVFRRGLWDAINKPASEPGKVGRGEANHHPAER